MADHCYQAPALKDALHKIKHGLVAPHSIGGITTGHNDGVKVVCRDSVGRHVYLHGQIVFAVVCVHTRHTYHRYTCAGFLHAQERIP